ncbi:DUF6612 family protein [Isobaculum melis]|uniref:Lipoprotein n=1 Tax=Isobaculum melis TaxID=142588 RepID=A0A1H9S0F5_9LACT|nr:DUF6612 family protein [Isobaculum melis]SER78424.1 hypothetical protein SAMN04488559_10610 [Isobaculum melis]
MKKSLPLILTVIVLLTGCSAPLNKDGVLKKIEEHQSKIDSYQLELGMSVDVKGNNGEKAYSELNLSADIQSKKEAYQINMSNDQEAKEIVIKDDKAYLKNGDDSWEEAEKKEAKALISQTDYQVFTKLINAVSDELKLNKKDADYLLSYEGDSQKLFKLLQKYYNVSFTGVDVEKDVTINLDAKVDKKTFNLKELAIVLTALNDSGKVVIEITIELDKFGQIKDIKAPTSK